MTVQELRKQIANAVGEVRFETPDGATYRIDEVTFSGGPEGGVTLSAWNSPEVDRLHFVNREA